ncbi:MAG TPA: protealysin inhibitor emfourin [Pseudomonas sp.]
MKICFVQSGGVVGAVRSCEVNTSSLQEPEAEELRQIVRESGLNQSCSFVSDQARDLKQYEITIEDETSPVCIVFDDQNVPASAQKLLGFLMRRAKPGGL